MQIRGLSLFLWTVSFLSFFCLFTASQSRSAEAVLSWTAPYDSRVTGYYIYYGTSSPEFKARPKITINSPNQTRCPISALKEGQTYYFAAKSFDAYGNESRFSETISYTVPDSEGPCTDAQTNNSSGANKSSHSGGGGCFINAFDVFD